MVLPIGHDHGEFGRATRNGMFFTIHRAATENRHVSRTALLDRSHGSDTHRADPPSQARSPVTWVGPERSSRPAFGEALGNDSGLHTMPQVPGPPKRSLEFSETQW